MRTRAELIARLRWAADWDSLEPDLMREAADRLAHETEPAEGDHMRVYQAAVDLVQATWPGYTGDTVTALEVIAASEKASARSPGVQAQYDAVRAQLEGRS